MSPIRGSGSTIQPTRCTGSSPFSLNLHTSRLGPVGRSWWRNNPQLRDRADSGLLSNQSRLPELISLCAKRLGERLLHPYDPSTLRLDFDPYRLRYRRNRSSGLVVFPSSLRTLSLCSRGLAYSDPRGGGTGRGVGDRLTLGHRPIQRTQR